MDDDVTRSIDLAAAWPDEDSLDDASQEESVTEQESYDAKAIGESEELPSDTGEGRAAGGAGSSPEGQEGGGVPGDDGLRGAAEGANEPASSSPVSWSASAREQWKKIPKEAQSYILQREQQMQQGMQKNAEQARRAEGMDRSLAPYQQYFAMNGGPGQTLQTLLQTGSGLQMGTPQQKAQIVANLINQFGVDIPSLDSLLTGKDVPPEVRQQSQVEQMLQQRLAPIQQQLSQYQQRERQMQQGVQQEASSELNAFSSDSKNEFYNDVRGDMADILDMAYNRGVQLTLKQAYDKACALNPEISRIQQSREQQRALQGKRRAAVSVTGGMSGPGATATPDSMRSAIESAWDNAGQM